MTSELVGCKILRPATMVSMLSFCAVSCAFATPSSQAAHAGGKLCRSCPLRQAMRGGAPPRSKPSMSSDLVPIASEVRFGRSESTRRIYYASSEEGIFVSATGERISEGQTAFSLEPSKMVSAVWARFIQTLYATFLPAGFPASLPPEYLRYQSWNVVQDLSSSLRGVLCTQKILEGMGVGNAAMTSLAATLLWMAKDGCSMLGGLAFTAAFSHRFCLPMRSWLL